MQICKTSTLVLELRTLSQSKNFSETKYMRSSPEMYGYHLAQNA